MSFLSRSVRAARSVRPPTVAQRRLETTYPQTAFTVQTLSQTEPEDFDIEQLEEFSFDEPTSLGHLRMQQLEEMRSLISKSELDRPALQAQAKRFKPPTGQIRVSRTVDLSDPDSPYHQKAVLLAPLSALPLSGPEAAHRLKLLAGPRWTPGKPGRGEMRPDGETGGWVKIAEESFPELRMNRKSASDMLERLVAAANDEKSPLGADTPLDPRHMLARQHKKKWEGRNVHARATAMAARPDAVGGVRGFPKEWLPQQPAQAEKQQQ